jgi:hypothetical protein
MWDLAWLIVDFVFSVGLDALLDGLSGLPKAEKSPAGERDFALVGAAIVGALVGGLSGWAAPERVLPPGPFGGVSLIILPVFLGITMELWGRLRRRSGGKVSALASWYGGAILGVFLAGGRLATLG